MCAPPSAHQRNRAPNPAHPFRSLESLRSPHATLNAPGVPSRTSASLVTVASVSILARHAVVALTRILTNICGSSRPCSRRIRHTSQSVPRTLSPGFDFHSGTRLSRFGTDPPKSAAHRGHRNNFGFKVFEENLAEPEGRPRGIGGSRSVISTQAGRPAEQLTQCRFQRWMAKLESCGGQLFRLGALARQQRFRQFAQQHS